MPQTYNDVGQNARKAKPSSLFGTRELKFFVIGANYDFYHDDIETSEGDEGVNADLTESYTQPNSVYAQVVSALQTGGELFYLAPPNSFDVNNFVFAVATDTSNWDTNPKNLNDWPNLFLEVGKVFADTPVGGDWGWSELQDAGFGLLPFYP
jgi:hypothetical protein